MLSLNYLLKIIGTFVVSSICGYLLWLLFQWITPLILNLRWFAALLLWLCCTSLILGLLATITSLLSIPVLFLTRDNRMAKYLHVIIMILFVIDSIMILFRLDMNLNVFQWIIAIALCGVYVRTFIGLMLIPFKAAEA